MFWFIVPVLAIGAIVVSSETNTKDEKEREAKSKFKFEKKKQRRMDIENFKEESVSKIKKRYNANIFLDSILDFSKEEQSHMSHLYKKFSSHLNSERGTSFLTFKGELKKDKLDKHLKELSIMIKPVLEQNTKYKIFDKKNLKEFDNSLDFFYNSEVGFIGYFKNFYKAHDNYRNLIKNTNAFATMIENTKTLEKIKSYIINNIGEYKHDFNNHTVTLLSKEETIKKSIQKLKLKTYEIEQLIKELKVMKNGSIS